MGKKNIKAFSLGLVGIGLLAIGGLITWHYQTDMDQAYRRIASGSKIVQTDCGPIEYGEFGEGEPVLIIHGSGGGYDQGAYFAHLIGGKFHWIAPSRFGFLGTPAPQGANSELQADAYACLLDALKIKRAGVVGISLGGPSALLFAQRHPERVTSLVMASAASHPIPARPAFQTLVFKAFLNDFVYWSIIHTSKAGLLDILGVPAAFQKELSPEELGRAYAFVDDILPMSARVDGQLLEGEMSQFDVSLIKQIQAPTLVVHARDDSLVPFDHASFTAQNVAGAELITLEKGGHLALMFNINAKALTQVEQFLAQHNP
jgi:2-hydroxy-6-oxonona-2,4-dienedioate hydrolase